MKLFLLTALSLVLSLSLLQASPRAAEKGGAKITKNEAEHIALKHHERARVTAAKLETVAEKLVWSIDIAQGKNVTHVAVDAMSGRIVPVKKPKR